MRNTVGPHRGIGLGVVVALLGVVLMLTLGHGSKSQWSQTAQAAKLLKDDAIRNAEKELATLPTASRQRAEKLLDEMSAVEPSEAGVRAATAKLNAALPGFVDPNSESSGDDPSLARIKQCALLLLHGLIVKAGEKVAQQPNSDAAAAALISAVREIQLFGRSNSGSLLSEARLGLGPPLYDRGLEKADAAAAKAKP